MESLANVDVVDEMNGVSSFHDLRVSCINSIAKSIPGCRRLRSWFLMVLMPFVLFVVIIDNNRFLDY